jgi:hypothetical protein
VNWRSNDQRNQNREVATKPVARAYMRESVDKLLAWYDSVLCRSSWPAMAREAESSKNRSSLVLAF